MTDDTFAVSGNIVDIENGRIYSGTVTVTDGRIANITEDANAYDTFLLPGFVDAHIHIESSLLVPSEFARLAVRHGTVATVSDPHEIGNVLGMDGVDYMLCNGSTTPFKFYFGAPSCVPATAFETAGAAIGIDELTELLGRKEIKFLSEMMNFPGVLYGDPQVRAKLALARTLGKVIDGHAPGLRGDMARTYFGAGISTDHECFTLAEAEDKLACGAHILIREGSAACNFDVLWPLIARFPERVMFCSDDKHPDSLLAGHINGLVRESVARGVPVMDALRAACVNPVRHYGLEVGLLGIGDTADFIEVDNLREFNARRVWIGGAWVAENGDTRLSRSRAGIVNHFNATPKRVEDFRLAARGPLVRVIEAVDGQIVTGESVAPACIENDNAVSNTHSDVLKIAVVNRYTDAPPAVGFVRGFGLKHGALASSVAHDSHNVIAVGTDDELLCRAVNAVIAQRGGLAAVSADAVNILPLPVAGLMSNDDGFEVAAQYEAVDAAAKALGCPLAAPFMTLSFMALLVIPSLKMSDLGLFDGGAFAFTDVFVSPESETHDSH